MVTPAPVLSRARHGAGGQTPPGSPLPPTEKSRGLPRAGGPESKQPASPCRSRTLILRKSPRSCHLGSAPFYFPSLFFFSLCRPSPCASIQMLSSSCWGFSCVHKSVWSLRSTHISTAFYPAANNASLGRLMGFSFKCWMRGRGGRQRGGASKPDTGSGKSWEINGFMVYVRYDQPNFTSENSHMAGLWECRKESKCSLGHVPSCHFPHIVRPRPDVTVCSTRPAGRRPLPQETWARPCRFQHRGDQPTLGSRHGISPKQTGRRGHEDSSIQRHTCVHGPHQIPTEPPTGH